MSSVEVGKTYKVDHCRKGKFTMKVSHVDDEWVHGHIVEGVALALMDYNIKEASEKISVRRSLAKFEEVVDGK
jgi:hypothetical protein